MTHRYNDEERFAQELGKSRFERLKDDRIPQKIAEVALAGIALVSFGRVIGETLHEIGAQHDGESTGAEVIDLLTTDFNAWNLNKNLYIGDETGHHTQHTVNDVTAAVTAVTAVALKNKARNR